MSELAGDVSLHAPMEFAPAPGGSWLLFEVDGQVCGIDSRQLRQIALAASVCRLPGSPQSAWPGLIAWQQGVLAVLDCGAALGRSASLGGPAARVLVVQDRARLWALLVNRVRGLHQDDPARLIEVQRGLSPPWNAVRALLPLPVEAGGDICPLLHVPTLCRDCGMPVAAAPMALIPAAESRA